MTTAKESVHGAFSSFGDMPTLTVRRGNILTPCRRVHVFKSPPKRPRKGQHTFYILRLRRDERATPQRSDDDTAWGTAAKRSLENWASENAF